MRNQQRAREVFESLARDGMDHAELFLKTGRSRRYEKTLQGRLGGSSSEQGWAVRASTSRASMFVAGTGLPTGRERWPEPDGQPLQLPSPMAIPHWHPPPDLDLPLATDAESEAMIDGVERALQGEMPGGRLLIGALEEGSSETSIFNTTGLEVSFRRRVAMLRVEAVGPWVRSPSCAVRLAARDHRGFQPRAIGSRLANLLTLTRESGAPMRERGEILVGPAVVVRILNGLLPMLLGREGEKLTRAMRNRQGRLGSALLTVVDDGRFNGGVLSAPVDGEGCPTGPRVLIEEGTFRHSLIDWRETGDPSQAPIGCMRREGWRDLPRVGPSHLFIRPRPETSVGDLLAAVSRGYYLIEALGPGRFDFARDRFRMPVCGFVLRQGAATGPVSHVWLEGGIRALLEGIQAVGRDLSFEPLGPMIGAPTLLLAGVGLRRID